MDTAAAVWTACTKTELQKKVGALERVILLQGFCFLLSYLAKCVCWCRIFVVKMWCFVWIAWCSRRVILDN